MARRVIMVVSNGLGSDPRVEKEADALSSAGWEVVVLAWDREGALPQTEQRGGWLVERLGPRAAYGGGPRSFPRFRDFWRRATARATELAPDIVHCHDLDTAPVGMRVVRRGEGPPRLVLDLHELYGESNMVPQSGLTGLVARFAVSRVERSALSAAAAVLVANPGSLDHYRGRVAEEQLFVVENAPDDAFFRPAPALQDRPFTVGYFGQMRYASELERLVDAVRDLPGVAAVLAGGGTAAERVQAYASGVDRVEVRPSFAYEELPDLYRLADVVYAVYDSALGNVRTLFPVKVMEAMACGIPSIVAEGTWIARFVVDEGIGVAVPPGDVEALAAAIGALKDDREGADAMGRAGRRLVEAGLNWQSSAGRLLGAYSQL